MPYKLKAFVSEAQNISVFIIKLYHYLQQKLFHLNACRNLTLNLTPDQDVFENEIYE